MDYTSVGLQHRQGAPTFKLLILGQENTPANFNLMLARQESFFSPRHHHNFEQFRYAYKGDISLGEGEEWLLREGQLAYFPEGVYYGPQNDGKGVREVLVLQFGGPSRQGYLSFRQLHDVQMEMTEKGVGTFSGGKFIPTGEEAESTDGYEALWQYQNRQKLRYPVSRYRHPLLIQTGAFNWQQARTNENAKMRPLGVFSDGSIAANQIQIDSGHFQVTGQEGVQLLFFLKGTAEVGDHSCREQSAIHLDSGEETIISAGEEGAEILHFVLPNFDK
jgi:mannose-6-phosphate isomerase-like protein (cupin superfamily)